MLYFKKENLRAEIRDGKGQVIAFEPVASGAGVISLDEANADDALKLAMLSDYASKRVGGVVKISAEIFDSLKKNALSEPSPQRSSFLNQMRVTPSPESFSPRVGAPSVVAARPPNGITIMEDNSLPPSSIQSFRERARSRPIGGQPGPDPNAS